MLANYLRFYLHRKCACFLVLVALLGVNTGCQNRQGISPGDMAPTFTLTEINGGTRSLSEFKGSVVVLNFLASWCGPCREELPALERLNLRMKGKGLTVLGVGVDDDLVSLKQIVQEYGITFPVVIDLDSQIKSAYKVGGIPETYIIDQQGRVALFIDVNRGPTTKAVGPREWDSPHFQQQLFPLLP